VGCLARRMSGHRQAEAARVLDVLRCASSVQLPERWGKPPEPPLRCGTRTRSRLQPARLPRSSFRSWCSDQGIGRELAEQALADAVGSQVEQCYARSDCLERRRAVIEERGAFLTE